MLYRDYAEMMDDMAADFAQDFEGECSDYEDEFEDEFDYDDYDECGFNPYIGAYDFDC